MPVSSLLQPHSDMRQSQHDSSMVDALSATILDHLNEQTAITLDSLVCLMPEYSWNQIFHCVDQLARCNTVVLRRHRFAYTLFSPTFLA